MLFVESNRAVRNLLIALLAGTVLFGLFAYLHGPFGAGLTEDRSWAEKRTMSDFFYLALVGFHALWLVIATVFRRDRPAAFSRTKAPEILAFLTIVLYLFSYVYALSANMDYVQRFALGSENLRLAPESGIERLNASLRFGPFLAVDAAWFVVFRVGRFRRGTAGRYPDDPVARWGLLIALGSAFLYALSFPSFLDLDGIPLLGYIALVPLFVVFHRCRYGDAVFHGIVFGTIEMMVVSYWLGTYSLISLQFLTVVSILLFTGFMVPGIWIFKRTSRWGYVVLPSMWVVFDYIRSLGFLGFPWAMIGTSQYPFIPLIQTASVTGVWGITFLVVAVNASIARLVVGRIYPAPEDRIAAPGIARSDWMPLAATLTVLLIAVISGSVTVAVLDSRTPERTVRLALIQQNTDPRKHEYRKTFDILTSLTDSALPAVPDLAVWSETAFVPNIERWGRPEYAYHQYGILVRDLLDYQRSIGTWLLTGNDDYEFEIGGDGEEIRRDYNASILFSDTGERVRTYHKINLVPFTETFPYKNQLPGIYRLLLDFDVYLWEAGTERVVFSHPLFTFSTPICFEDNFPDDIRRFVMAGAEVIITLANDYWSLDEVEAMQHYANSVFRTVENRRPLARATASGRTSHVDDAGRLRASLPYYEEGVLIVDVEIHRERTTLYTRFGDWLPYMLMGAVAAILVVTLPRRESTGTT